MDLPDRQSIRLKQFDYSQVGFYFVTICSHQHRLLFGQIVSGEMQLNIAGQLVFDVWQNLSVQHPNIVLHDFIIMPNHFHGVIQITYQTQDTIGVMVQTFKRITTNGYINLVKQHQLPRFSQRIWQRNYWERVIRDEQEFNNICGYIQRNPKTWDEDTLNPDNGL